MRIVEYLCVSEAEKVTAHPGITVQCEVPSKGASVSMNMPDDTASCTKNLVSNIQ